MIILEIIFFNKNVVCVNKAWIIDLISIYQKVKKIDAIPGYQICVFDI